MRRRQFSNTNTDTRKINKFNVVLLERTTGKNIIHSQTELLQYWFDVLKTKAALVEVDPSEHREAGTILYHVTRIGAEVSEFYKGEKIDLLGIK